MALAFALPAEAGYSCTREVGQLHQDQLLGQPRPLHALHGVHVRQHTPDELQLRHHRQARRPDNPVPRQDRIA